MSIIRYGVYLQQTALFDISDICTQGKTTLFRHSLLCVWRVSLLGTSLSRCGGSALLASRLISPKYMYIPRGQCLQKYKVHCICLLYIIHILINNICGSMEYDKSPNFFFDICNNFILSDACASLGLSSQQD